MIQQKANIYELKAPSENVTVVAKILSLNPRVIKNDRGETLYYYGLIGDSTGSIPFTAWSFPSGIKVGDVVEIRRGSLKDYKGSTRLYLDSRSEVILHPEESIEVKASYRLVKIGEIKPGMRYISLKAVATSVSSRDLSRDDQKITMFYGRLEDDTGSIRFTSFGVPIEQGDQLFIEGASVREFRGSLQVSINDRAKVARTTLDFEIGSHIKNIGEITAPVGGVELFAVAVSLGEKSGLVYRCSQCRNRLDEIRCPDHPDAPILYDIFAYFTVDDGTGSILCTAGSGALLKLIGIKSDEFTPSNRSISKRSVIEMLQKNILGNGLVITGDVVSGTGGLSVRGRDISHIDASNLSRLSSFLEADFT
ncbi:MAG TPA: replication protein A [Thermoplasmataceae archaeon]|nr:replication protein A [Thermoplasmatales archaeon AK]HLH86214.1 replication protein A [Thermoplasmataceae archaeon]